LQAIQVDQLHIKGSKINAFSLDTSFIKYSISLIGFTVGWLFLVFLLLSILFSQLWYAKQYSQAFVFSSNSSHPIFLSLLLALAQ
jgi:hypothetical protein